MKARRPDTVLAFAVLDPRPTRSQEDGVSKRVMVPLDGSHLSLEALSLAMGITDADDVIELVTVVEPAPAFAVPDYEEVARGWAREYLERVTGDLAKTDRKVEAVTLMGRPPEALAARSGTADLVVIATHGRGPVSRMWLGSVADHLLRESLSPVLLLRPDENGDGGDVDLSGPGPSLRRILVPLDGADASEKVLSVLPRLLGRDLEVTLLRVARPPAAMASPYLAQGAMVDGDAHSEVEDAARTYVEDVARRLAGAGVAATGVVRTGEYPSTAITDYAEKEGVDLIAMSTHGAGGLKRAVIGSVADKVVRSSPVPVLTLRLPDDEGS